MLLSLVMSRGQWSSVSLLCSQNCKERTGNIESKAAVPISNTSLATTCFHKYKQINTARCFNMHTNGNNTSENNMSQHAHARLPKNIKASEMAAHPRPEIARHSMLKQGYQKMLTKSAENESYKHGKHAGMAKHDHNGSQTSHDMPRQQDDFHLTEIMHDRKRTYEMPT